MEAPKEKHAGGRPLKFESVEAAIARGIKAANEWFRENDMTAHAFPAKNIKIVSGWNGST